MHVPELTDNSVHVWSFSVLTTARAVTLFEAVLSEQERTRAAQFAFPYLRDGFIVTRGMLRCLLGCYLGRDPAEIKIAYGTAGKPVALNACGIEFNVTHSGQRAAVAVTRGCEIGIDREQRRIVAEMDSIARRYFCDGEAAAIMGLSEGERERAFFCCWARKEAYIKATGGGLEIPLHAFEVNVNPHAPARLLHVEGSRDAAAGWTLRDLWLHPDDAAAVAYQGAERPLSIFAVNDAGVLRWAEGTDARF